MAMLSLKEILAQADKHKFGIGAFNVVDSNFADAIFTAAKEQASPIIINMAQVHFEHFDVECLSQYIIAKAAREQVPVCLNLDHGLTMDAVERAINCGFTSVMFDGSAHSYAENVKMTQEVVRMCHGKNISVEAELGAVGGDETGSLYSQPDEAMYTKVEQAKEFVELTNIDALAVAIGNSHGNYKGEPKLDLERLAAIDKEVNIPLVLHGGSGLSTSDFKNAIAQGIAKINFYTGMSQAALASIKNDIDSKELAKMYDQYLLTTKNMRASIKDTVVAQMEIFGSVNKAHFYD